MDFLTTSLVMRQRLDGPLDAIIITIRHVVQLARFVQMR
jgi:hypothetical protein